MTRRGTAQDPASPLWGQQDAINAATRAAVDRASGPQPLWNSIAIVPGPGAAEASGEHVDRHLSVTATEPGDEISVSTSDFGGRGTRLNVRIATSLTGVDVGHYVHAQQAETVIDAAHLVSMRDTEIQWSGYDIGPIDNPLPPVPVTLYLRRKTPETPTDSQEPR